MNTLYHRRSNCRLCEKNQLVLVLKLKPSPYANAFVKANELNKKQHLIPLDLFFCENCNHLQLLDVVDPRILFENYVYVSGTSPVFVKHFEDYVNYILEYYPQLNNTLVIDIGSNDGTLLKIFKRKGYKILGIDPAKEIAKKAALENIETLPIFFNPDTAKIIREKYGTASIITANNIFAHVDDLKGFIEGIQYLLSKNGIFVFEVSYLVDVIDKKLFDMTYHEHLSYHSVHPLTKFFEINGMQLIEVIRTDVHGGSLRGIVQWMNGPHIVGSSVNKLIELEMLKKMNSSQTYIDFGKRVKEHGKDLSILLQQLKSDGKKIAGFGAPAKATTLMYHFGIDHKIIDFIVDDNTLKQNLFSPGMHIPILPTKYIYEKKPDYLLILAWNFAESIMKNHMEFRNKGGHFIVPLPKLEVY